METQIGDIFSANWGYDQTNIDFVKVVRLSPSGKSAYCVRIGKTVVEGSEGNMSEQVVPNAESVQSAEFKLKVGEYNGKAILRGSYIFCADEKRLDSLWKYDGKPLYQSHYA